MLTPIRLLADPDALPPSPPSDLAWLRTCGAAGIEKEGKNCERRRGPEKWDDLWCTTPEADGSYFKFKDVTLGYTLPSNLTQKLNISNMRVYLSAQNLWTISSYPGYDPEVSYSVNNSKTMGEDAMTVPQLRTFVCGFNLTF